MLTDENVSGGKDRSERSKYSLCIVHRLRRDCQYRRRICLTLAVYWSYMNLGWVVLQIGTALPDLQILVDVDLETASWLFTTWSLGVVTGSLFCGFLYDRINKLVIMFVCTIGVGVCSIGLPYSKSLSMMIILRVLCGIFCGGIDTGANTIVPSIWGLKGGPFMQALYLSYTVGSIASPFATEPFVSTAKHLSISDGISNKNNSENRHTITQNSSGCISCADFKSEINRKHVNTLGISTNNYTSDSIIHNNSSGSNTFVNEFKDDVHIHKAFIITSVLLICSAIPYLAMVLIGGFDTKATADAKGKSEVVQEVEPLQETAPTIAITEIGSSQMKGKRKYFVLSCIASVNLLYSATEDSLADFVVTFALDYLEWNISSSVSLISLYWTGSCIGGLAGVLLVRSLRPTKLLFFAHLLWIITFLLTLLGSLFRIDVMIWIFIPSSGFFMVLIIPAAISWTEENVCQVTGRIASVFLIATGTGTAANPRFLGYMMEKYTYITLPCILFIESVICFGFYVLAFIFRHFRYTPDSDMKAELHH